MLLRSCSSPACVLRVLLAVVLALLAACAADDGGADGLAPDGLAPDGLAVDAAQPDGGAPDAGPDAAVPDVAVPDVAVPDVAVPDVAVPDVAVPDSAPDAAPDVAPPDAGADVAVDPRWTGHWLPEDDRVHVLRDEWGVPHVFARDAWGAGYGTGQAQAEDQLDHLLRNLWTVRGRRGEADGSGLWNIDRTMRLIRLVDQAEAHWDEFHPTVRAVFEGFAAGVNDWMAAHPESVPAWAEPIEPAWSAAFANLLFVDGQLDQCNADRGAGVPPLAVLAFDGWVEFRNPELPPGLAPGTKAAPGGPWTSGDAARGMVGSNAWTVAPGRSAEPGAGFFVGDPHMPWNGAWTLWELHVRTPEVEVAGATFLGLPLPVFGRTADVAWSFTMNTVENGDAYRLTLDPADPERYLFDGESVAFEAKDEVFRAAGGEEVTLRLRWSMHGPVTWHDPAAGFATAYRYVTLDQPGAAPQFHGMMTARDLDEFEAAMGQLQLTRFHVLAADADGGIFYAWNGRLPRRPPGYDYRAPLDGTTSATLWDLEDVVPFHELPRLRDPATGWIQNCNNAPWNNTLTAEDPLAADFPIYGLPGDDDSERAWRLRRELAADADLTLAEALALGTQGDMIAAETFLPLLRTAWDTWGAAHPDADRLADAMAALAGWEGEPTLTSPAPTVFLVFMLGVFDTVFPPPEAFLWTEADLDEALGQRLLDALASGLDLLQDQVGVWQVPWGALHAINVGPRRFPVASAQYPAVSLFNCNVDPVNDATLTCRVGSAYTFLALTTRPMQSWSVLPLGQAPDRELPYRYAQTEAYARRELKLLAFSDAELATLPLTETVFEPPRPE